MDDDWGEIQLINITCGSDLYCLFYEIYTNNSDYINDIDMIFESYRDNNLYGLQVCETDSMFQRNARKDSIFCQNPKTSLYLLPCFCIKKNSDLKALWTHPRIRNKGFAKNLLFQLGLDKSAIT